MTQEKILQKLAKIKAHGDSAKEIGNEAEAQAFAAKLQELLLQHKLELTDIQYAQEMKEEPIIEHWPEVVGLRPNYPGDGGKRVYKSAPDVEVIGERRGWVEALAHIVTSAYSCNFLVSNHTSNICIVGHKSNVEICEYLFITMLRAAEHLSKKAAMKFRREWREAHGGPGNTPGGYRESWLGGFISRIGERMKEERRKFEGDGGMALVRINKEALAVRSYVENKFAGRKPAESKEYWKQMNAEGYAAGKKTADGLNLNANAVKAGQPNQQHELE